MKVVTMNSPNHWDGRHGWKADVLCCHQSGNHLDDSLSWYTRNGSNCCPTWVVDQDGTIYQMMSLDDAPMSNGTQTKPNEKLYYGLATSKLVKERKTNANWFCYSIEFIHWLKGDITEQQIEATVYIIKEIINPHMKKNGLTPKWDRDHIIGHCEVDPVGRAFCPGVNFPYQKIIDLANGKAAVPAATPAPTVTPNDKVENIKSIMQSVGIAAIRSNTTKNEPNPQRCKKGSYYAFDQQITKANGEVWLRHAGVGFYSMYKDGGFLFRKEGTYTRYKTTSALKVRSAPSLSGSKVDEFCAGAYVYVLDDKPVLADKYTWVKVLAGGKIGYSAREYMKEVKE